MPFVSVSSNHKKFRVQSMGCKESSGWLICEHWGLAKMLPKDCTVCNTCNSSQFVNTINYGAQGCIYAAMCPCIIVVVVVV